MVNYYLSLCAIIKNERYLEEFITYYKILGVEHFYIYDNQSNFPIRHRLDHPFYSDFITFVDFCGDYQQLNAYNHCLKNFGKETEWLIVVDGDEFIVPKHSWTIRDFLNKYEDVAAIGINWVIFGSNYHDKRPEGYLIENYTRCSSKQDEQLKCIVKPKKCIEFITVHHPKTINPGEFVDPHRNVIDWFRNNNHTIDIIQINHYRYKSKEDCIEKNQRGYNDPGTKGAVPHISENLHESDNDIEDKTIVDRYLPHIKLFNIPKKDYF